MAALAVGECGVGDRHEAEDAGGAEGEEELCASLHDIPLVFRGCPDATTLAAAALRRRGAIKLR
jgi:hypothetical protein